MQNVEVLRAFYSRVAPAIPELFNMAYAISGNYDLAEYALNCTLMEAWNSDSHGGIGFREGMRNTLRRVAVQEALEPKENAPEFTWDGLAGESGDVILCLLAGEGHDTRRAVALRYGCGLPLAKAARLMGLPVGRVKELLERFERAACRRLPPSERRGFEMRLAKAVRRAFERADESMPSLGLIYRAFEAEALEARRPNRFVSKLVRRTVAVVLAVICALVFWFAAVLIQPPQVEQLTPIVAEEGQ